MTLNVANGFRFDLDSLEQVYRALVEFQQRIQMFATILLGEQIAIAAVDCYDAYCSAPEVLPTRAWSAKSPMSYTWEGIMKAQRIGTLEQQKAELDFEASLVILPTPGSILGIPFLNHGAFQMELTQAPWYRSYAYWSNAVPEEGVTGLEWQQRRSHWLEAFPEEMPPVPALRGFEFRLCHRLPIKMPSLQEVAGHFPSFAERQHALAMKVFQKRRMSRLGLSLEDVEQVMQLLSDRHDGLEALRTSEGRQEYQDIREELLPKMKPTIELEDLRAPFLPKQAESADESIA